ncbi:flavin reductase family protein [Eisenibacter elegans]|uniref:flavin reductase family protein n=1 Tax=Eisenibacter elegans TaxID=997 RepID=UPI000554C182|nr:flavin reductase family protein [Eisenibacter elegans]
MSHIPTLTLDPGTISTAKLHAYMLSAVAPRPIAFASTIDAAGNVNLSPFSFFNVFGSNPPIMIFAPARRVRDNTTKHSFENVREVPEAVINIVNYPIVEQMSLASTEYAKGVNEFVKSGLTPVASDLVRPPRVAEAPAAFECKVTQIIETGQEGGAGALIICEVLRAHIHEAVLDAEGHIDPFKIDLVARMGGNWYCRANGEALFEIPKPLVTKGIGVDQLPQHIRQSDVLTGNNLARLANVESLPQAEAVAAFQNSPEAQQLLTQTLEARHQYAQRLLAQGKVAEAWLVLLLD